MDKPKMRQLAGGSFSPCEYRYYSKIPNSYHLKFDGHYYSTPFSLYGQPAFLKATISEIRICDRNNKLVCTHKRSYADYPKYITKPEHMPEEHRYYKEVNEKNGSYYRSWAKCFGPYTAKLIDSVMLSADYEEQAYNSCNGILHMCTDKPRLLVEEAARTCIEANACKYTYFKKCLNRLNSGCSAQSEQRLPEHGNLRRKEIYR